MTEDDKEALNEFLRGVIFTIGIIGGLVLCVSIFGTSKEPPKGQFEVVDSYKKCDVVQYLPKYSGTYYYLLDCSSVQND